MTTKGEAERIRRPYCKPKLEHIRLALEEAVLSGCKATALAPGPFNAGVACYGAPVYNYQCFYLQS